MRTFYTILMMTLSLGIAAVIYWMGNKVEVNLYWLNSACLIFIIGIAAYYRYKEYEKNKGA